MESFARRQALGSIAGTIAATTALQGVADAKVDKQAFTLELDKVTKDTPGFQVSSLRERELTYANSVYLHESYFENLGGNGKAAGEFSKVLATQFGSSARWEEQVRATAMSLGGGSGWVVIALSPLTNDLRIVGSGGVPSCSHPHPHRLSISDLRHLRSHEDWHVRGRLPDRWF